MTAVLICVEPSEAVDAITTEEPMKELELDGADEEAGSAILFGLGKNARERSAATKEPKEQLSKLSHLARQMQKASARRAGGIGRKPLTRLDRGQRECMERRSHKHRSVLLFTPIDGGVLNIVLQRRSKSGISRKAERCPLRGPENNAR